MNRFNFYGVNKIYVSLSFLYVCVYILIYIWGYIFILVKKFVCNYKVVIINSNLRSNLNKYSNFKKSIYVRKKCNF